MATVGLHNQPTGISSVTSKKFDGGVHAYIAQMYKDLTVKNNVADLRHGDDPDPAEADV